MNNSDVFKLISSLISFYGKTVSQKKEDTGSQSDTSAKPFSDLFSSFTSRAPTENRVKEEIKTPPTVKPPVNDILRAANAHDAFVKRVKGKK